MYACIHICVPIYYIYIYLHIYMYMYMCIYIYIYIYAYEYIGYLLFLLLLIHNFDNFLRWHSIFNNSRREVMWFEMPTRETSKTSYEAHSLLHFPSLLFFNHCKWQFEKFTKRTEQSRNHVCTDIFKKINENAKKCALHWLVRLERESVTYNSIKIMKRNSLVQTKIWQNFCTSIKHDSNHLCLLSILYDTLNRILNIITVSMKLPPSL
jgi:hypothetical protein